MDVQRKKTEQSLARLEENLLSRKRKTKKPRSNAGYRKRAQAPWLTAGDINRLYKRWRRFA